MSLYTYRFASALVIISLAVALAPARADDAETAKKKLDEAKKAYEDEADKFKKAMTELFDKREADARKAGNKKLLDQIKAEQKAFEKSGELPAAVPVALQTPIKVARAKLDKAYTTAIKDFTKLKDDIVAEALEKEQEKFFAESAALFGKKTYLVTLKHYDVKALNDWFANNGTLLGHKIKKDGEPAPHSIFLHAFDKGSARVKYTLGGKWVAFRATVGVPTVEDDKPRVITGLTFEVFGDDKSLWKSEPITKSDDFQTCTVRIEKVKVLTLQVNSGEKGGRSVWFEPVLIE